MLSDNIKEHLLDLDECSLNDLINILQSFANDSSFNVHQTGFGSYIANHVIKEKIQCYNSEVMIAPMLGDVWLQKILIAVGKESYHATWNQVLTFSLKNYMICLIETTKWKNVTLIYILLMILPSML
jgi:hypothetical protein